MRAIPKLVSAPSNPTPVVEHLRWSHPQLAEFILETNYSSETSYPSEADNSSKYKFGAKMNYGAKFACG